MLTHTVRGEDDDTTITLRCIYCVWSAHADTGPYVSGSFRRVCGLGG